MRAHTRTHSSAAAVAPPTRLAPSLRARSVAAVLLEAAPLLQAAGELSSSFTAKPLLYYIIYFYHLLLRYINIYIYFNKNK